MTDKFTFDGKGINDANDQYRQRLATLTDAGHEAKIGPLLAAAPEMLTHLQTSLEDIERAIWNQSPSDMHATLIVTQDDVTFLKTLIAKATQ